MLNMEKKLKWIKGMIRLIAFLLILFICFSIIHDITKRKNAYVKMSDFFNQKENFDVLFFGTSHPV